jgi:hypothetical protein
MRRFLCLASLVSIVAVVGCAQKPTVVSGSVSWDGNPVKEGSIHFSPKDGKGQTAGGPITDGKYSVEVLPGSYVVKIYWPKQAAAKAGSDAGPGSAPPGPGSAPPGAGSGERKEEIPDKYNEKSTLTLDVSGATLQKDWPLTK